jgi:hypothetical protein
MADQCDASLRERYQAIEQRLEAAAAPRDRDAIKAEIIALFRSVEQETADLAALREEIKVLVERWKRMPGAARPATPPQVEGMKPVMADHLGASTYVEKGWSLI